MVTPLERPPIWYNVDIALKKMSKIDIYFIFVDSYENIMFFVIVYFIDKMMSLESVDPL